MKARMRAAEATEAEKIAIAAQAGLCAIDAHPSYPSSSGVSGPNPAPCAPVTLPAANQFPALQSASPQHAVTSQPGTRRRGKAGAGSFWRTLADIYNIDAQTMMCVHESRITA